MAKMLKKRCERCGNVKDVRARQRKCHERRFGPGSYCCWGRLVVVKEPRKEARMRRRSSTENAARRSPQAVAKKKQEHAEKMIDEKVLAMARIMKQIQAWRRKAIYYDKRARMTDAEIAAEAQKRHEAKARRPKRRAILRGNSVFRGTAESSTYVGMPSRIAAGGQDYE